MDMLRGGFMPGLLGNGMGVATGGGSSYAAETEAIAAAFTTPPTTARKNLIDACVVSLKTAGVWAKLDCMYVLAAADSQAAIINWKAPGSFNLTQVNTPTFAADGGFTGNAGGTKYLDSAWDPTANGVNYTLNSASIHHWSLTSSNVDAAYEIGAINSPNTVTINASSAAGSIEAALNSTAIVAYAAGGTVGMFSLSRTGSGSYTISKNGTSLGPAATASGGLTALDFRICAVNSGFGSARQLSFAAWAAGLTAGEITSFYNPLRTYMTGVGIP